MHHNQPIGFIDSGIGGLTIWRAVKRLLPDERFLYLADQAYFPYGTKDPDALCERLALLSGRLIEMGAKIVVLACNTASVEALAHVRACHPRVPFVGVVPVIKTLGRYTHTGTIALLCTSNTAKSAYTANLAREFAPESKLLIVDCLGLENIIEAGRFPSKEIDGLLEQALVPVKQSDADVVGLGCTHYPLVRHAIKRALGPGYRVFEPSMPVARRVRYLVEQMGAAEAEGSVSGDVSIRPEGNRGTNWPVSGHFTADTFYTTGEGENFERLLRGPLRLPEAEVRELVDL